MNRFSVIYLLKKQYHTIFCATHAEAIATLTLLADQNDHVPIGVYDAKTELFDWEPVQQSQYNQSSIEEQGKLGDQIIQIAQQLRQQDEVTQAQGNSVFQPLRVEAA